MAKYVLIESRDPFDYNGVAHNFDLAAHHSQRVPHIDDKPIAVTRAGFVQQAVSAMLAPRDGQNRLVC